MIPIEYLTGDATEPIPNYDNAPRIIAHVCNDLGGWGAGFVLALSAKWSIPEEQYRKAMQVGRLRLGDIQLYGVDDRGNILVCNMLAQHGYRASQSNPVPLDYNALAVCLSELRQEIKLVIKDASVHMPRIGCGLAGGTWDKVEAIIIEMLSAYDIPVFVYDLP